MPRLIASYAQVDRLPDLALGSRGIVLQLNWAILIGVVDVFWQNWFVRLCGPGGGC